MKRAGSIVAAVLALALAGAAVYHFTLQSNNRDQVASWEHGFHPGNPSATQFGAAYQILDAKHAPANATAVFWLGGPQDGLYPYVRAMLGHEAEIMLSTVIYADRSSADNAHLELTSWDTRAMPIAASDQGGKLEQLYQQLPKQQTNGYSWVSVPKPLPGMEALVQVGPHTILQINRLDGSAPGLAKLVAQLRPYPR